MRLTYLVLFAAVAATAQDGDSAGAGPAEPLESTVGPPSLAACAVSAAWGTAVDSPVEYDTDWGGCANRYGLRLTGVTTSNAMDAGLGAVWGEDPRYAAITAINLLSNTWRPDSQTTVFNALLRASYRFPGRMASNAVDFWPDIPNRVFRG